VGQNLDKLVTDAEQTQHRCRGGKLALQEQAKKLQSVHAYADAEFAEGSLDVETLSLVKRYVTRCIDATSNAAKQQEAEELASAGRVSAFREALALTANHHKVAKGRFDQLNTPLPKDEPDTERAPRKGRPSRSERKAAQARLDTVPKKSAAKKATKKGTAKKRIPKGV